MQRFERRLLIVLVVALLGLYVGSYAALSRHGYAEADRWGFKGFYYFPPEPTRRWEHLNYSCVWVYAPLNSLERRLGLGRDPAAIPLWSAAAIRAEEQKARR